jgi:mycofactocin precursor
LPPERPVAPAGTVWEHISSTHAAAAAWPGRPRGRQALLTGENASTGAVIETGETACPAAGPGTAGTDPEDTEELLVEEISIDGMCGVY